MKFRDYKKKRLKRRNHVINFFLLLLLSLTILALVVIGYVNASLNHFDERSDEISESLASVVIDNIDYDSSDFTDAIRSNVPVEIPPEFEEDPCRFLGLVDDPDIADVMRDMCGDGMVDLDEFAQEAFKAKVLDYQDEVRDTMSLELDNSISEGRQKMNSLSDKYFFLNFQILSIILAILLLLHMFNNDFVITLDYISKKMIYLVGFLFILPYFFAKANLLSEPLKHMDLSRLFQNLPIPLNVDQLLISIMDLLSVEFAAFYAQYLPYSIGMFVGGFALFFGNRYFILPNFAKHLAPETKPASKPKKAKVKSSAKKKSKKK